MKKAVYVAPKLVVLSQSEKCAGAQKHHDLNEVDQRTSGGVNVHRGPNGILTHSQRSTFGTGLVHYS